MRPRPWSPPVELSAVEADLVGRLKRKSRFFVFLRQIRHELLAADLAGGRCVSAGTTTAAPAAIGTHCAKSSNLNEVAARQHQGCHPP